MRYQAAATAIATLFLCAFTCQPESGHLKFAQSLDVTLNFTFEGVDDDETPNCFEVDRKIDLEALQSFLNSLPPGEKRVEVAEVKMAITEVLPANTATTITCNFTLERGEGETVAMGTIAFPVQAGTELGVSYDADRVGDWLTKVVLDQGDVTFKMTACMGEQETAGFKVRLDVKAEGSWTTPGW